MAINGEVLKAAKLLDDNVGKVSWLTPDWREKINLDELNMASVKLCILGQLAGDYDKGVDFLREQCDWYSISDGFCSWTSQWKEYLKDFGLVGSVWWDSERYDCCYYTVKALAEIDGVAHVLYTVNQYSDISVEKLSSFKADYYRKPVVPPVRFAKGDILKSSSEEWKNDVFIYISDDRVVRLNTSSPSYGALSFYESMGRMEMVRQNSIQGDAEFLRGLTDGEIDLTK